LGIVVVGADADSCAEARDGTANARRRKEKAWNIGRFQIHVVRMGRNNSTASRPQFEGENQVVSAGVIAA
jgi:hypothetical protein